MQRARELSEAARLNILQTAWQVRGALRTALLDLTAATRRQELLARQVDAIRSVTALLQQRFEVGAVSRLELGPYELAQVKSAGELADARRLAVEARGRVAEALGIPLAALDGFELRMDLATPPPAPAPGDPPALHRAALRNRADVRGLLADYAASEASLQLEIARQYPDVRLGPGYQWDQGDSKWTLAIALELPVLNRNQGPIAEAQARRVEVAARFTALQARVVAEVDRAVAGGEAAREQVARAHQLLETHNRQLERLRAALAAGAADSLEIRTAEVEAAAAELLHLDALVREWQMLGDLEQAIQAPLPGQDQVTPAQPSARTTPER
jgi:outer membrane protein TolC